MAKGRGLTVAETPFFARDEPIAGLGMAPAVGNRAFELKDGEVSEAIRSQNGFAFITVTGTQDSRLPTLDEVKARVRDDVQKSKAVEAAKQKAAALAAQLKSAGDFTAAAKAAGLEAKTTDLVVRGAALPDVGVSPAVDAAAFALRSGGVSDPIVTDNGAVIVKVVEKKSPTAEELAAGTRRREERAAQPAEAAVLRVLHDQGARADDDQVQPAGDRAGDWVALSCSAISCQLDRSDPAASKHCLSLELS